MAANGAPEKIAILGGGIAALVTAFELTSPPDWRDRFESITLHQMGWRLGGKCASSRGPNGRIEEHGIHGFLGSYYNALPLFAACYDELARPAGKPLATFEEAILPENFGVLWECRGHNPKAWAQRFPTNDRSPRDTRPFDPLQRAIAGVIESFGAQLLQFEPHGMGAAVKAQAQRLLERAAAALAADAVLGPSHPLVDIIDGGWRTLGGLIEPMIDGDDALRQLFIVIDHALTLVCGALKDDVGALGYDRLDDEDFSHWLARHGANRVTIASPLALNHINMTYQYPDGDTSRSPRMAAGCYVHWALQAVGYMGSFVWHFAAGTGESLIAPLYLVLARRGVKFEFFHKVEALRVSPDQATVASVEIAVQATLKAPDGGYDPLVEVKELPCWPAAPLFDQLVEGDAMKAAGVDLESYWTPWPAPRSLTLEAGRDFDRLVFAISIGAVPHLCAELLAARQPWRDMVAAIPALITQGMQIWLSEDLYKLGWNIPLRSGEMVFSATYLNPQNGQAEFSALLPYEDWPAGNPPRGLWYFGGLMVQEGAPPPFTDHDYPARQNARVKYQSIQYLQTAIGALLPAATTNATTPPGDPFGLNFDLLIDTRTPPGTGVQRFDSQFWRANIDPSERYVASPPGSTRYRLKAWDSGFSNLVLAGDWIYTGLNVGSVEGTVMSGKLAAHALCGTPPLNAIVGYPLNDHG